MKRLIFRIARLIWITPRLIRVWLVLRKPNPYFDFQYYAESNPHISKRPSALLFHYILLGENRGISPHRYFDPAYYTAINKVGEFSNTNGRAFAHFLRQGAAAHIRTGEAVDPAFYAERYPEFSETCTHPILHMQEVGAYKGYYPCAEIENLEKKPRVSIITPIYNTDSYFLKRCIESVLFQRYPHWELCLINDGSSRPGLEQELLEYTGLDSRIKLKNLEANQGISGASRNGLALASGEYIAFLDHDDELHPEALNTFISEINQRDPDILYSDEELVSETNRFLGGMPKPDFNLALLLNHNYITHFVMVRASLIDQIEPFPEGSDGAQDHDFLLKISEVTNNIVHLPRSLYKWRSSETSTSADAGQKPYAIEASKRAVESALERRGIQARVEPGKGNFFHDIHPVLEIVPSIDVIITPSNDTLQNTDSLKMLIEHCNNGNTQLHFNIARDSPLKAARKDLLAQNHIHLHSRHPQHSPAMAMNEIAMASSADLLAFIGPGVIPENSQWLSDLAAYALLDETGLAGGSCLGDINKHQPCINFPCPGLNHDGARYYKNFLLHGSRCLAGQANSQYTRFISSAFSMIKRETFQKLEGYDDKNYPQLMYDLDLSMRLEEQALVNTYVAFCRASQADEYGHTATPDDNHEKQLFQARWKETLTAGDPYHNINYLLQCTHRTPSEWLQWYA